MCAIFASHSLAGLVFGPRHSFFGKEISTLSSASSATSDDDDRSFVQAIETLYGHLEHAYYQKEADPAREWVESILASSRVDDNPAEVPRLVLLAKTGRMFLDILDNNTMEAYKAAYDIFPFLQSTLNNTDAESRTYGQLATLLSECYRIALGTKENATEAFRLLEIAAKQDLMAAQRDLSSHYFNGYGVPENEEQGVYWLRRAAEQGDADACFELANYFIDKGHNNTDTNAIYPEEAMQWLRVASQLNHLEAKAMLGTALVFGNNTNNHYHNYDEDIDHNNSSSVSHQEMEGVVLLKDAAERGHADAQFYYSRCLMEGRGNVEKDPQLAFHWLSSAAAQGHGAAELDLGLTYWWGCFPPYDLSIAEDYQKAVFWLRKAADKGFGLAQLTLGEFYLQGLGVEQDHEKAVSFFRQAANSSDASDAEEGYPVACSAYYMLSQCYRSGEGVQQDLQEAFRLLRVVAEKYNHTEGQKQVGDCYASGFGVDKDRHEAMRWYHKVAMQGYPSAQNALGLLLWEHPDLNNTTGLDAEGWFERAAALDYYPIAKFNLGMLQFEKKNYLSAVRWFKKAAELDEVNSLVMLARCYAEGLGVVEDQLEAFNCLEKAASLNNSDAQHSLGLWYYQGRPNVVRVDFNKARGLFVLAAKQNHSEAEYMVGLCCFNGQGAKQNYTSAVRYFRRAISHAKDNTTNMEAQHMLGVCLQQGLGTKKDLPAAFRLFNESAQAGYMDAQYSLGLCYRDGLGVRIDLAKARYWLREAADQGHDMARQSVHRLGKQNSQN
eukprot:gene22534-27503_t